MAAYPDISREHLSPEDETWAYLETLEQRAQLRKIRRTPVPVEVQPDEDDLL
jgi:hypothetical protein